jgi:hypothetical protein
MPGKPRDVHVQVYIHPGAPNGDYHFESKDLPMGKDNYLYFHNYSHPGLDVYYDIQPGTNYVFPDKNMTNNWKDEAVWAQQQPACPTAQTQWPTFQAKDVLNGGATLVVHNANPNIETFWYTLRVTNDRGTRYLPLDPGGGNENGQYSSNLATISLVALGSAIAGSLLTLGFQAALGS